MGSTAPEVRMAHFQVRVNQSNEKLFMIDQTVELERGSELIEQIKDLGGFVSFRDDTMVWYPLHRIHSITIIPIKPKEQDD